MILKPLQKNYFFTFDDFINNKFKRLWKFQKSSQESIRKWSSSLLKTSPEIFYEISKECVKYSKRSLTLSFLKLF